MADEPEGGWRGEVAFVRRTLIVVAIVALALVAWTAREALLLAFAAVIVAVLIRSVAALFRHYLRIPEGWSVAAACAALGIPLVMIVVLVGSEMQTQVSTLLTRLPDAVGAIERRFDIEIPLLGDSPRPGGPPADSSADASAVGAVARQAASAAVVAVEVPHMAKRRVIARTRGRSRSVGNMMFAP